MTSAALDSSADFSIRADAGEVRRASAWIEQACRERGVPPGEIGRLDICLNETLANILAHGGTAASSVPILLHLEVRLDGAANEATVTVSDAGTPFDPLVILPRMRPPTLTGAEPGGLGLTMIRYSADRLAYRHHEGRNRLSFGVCWGGRGDG